MLPSDSKRLQCNYRDLPKIVKPNDILHIDDGKIVCLVTDCDSVSHSYNKFLLEWNTMWSQRRWHPEKFQEHQTPKWKTWTNAYSHTSGWERSHELCIEEQ